MGHLLPADDLASEGLELAHQCVGQRPGAALGKGPAHGVACHQQHQTNGSRGGLIQRQYRMGGEASEPRLGAGIAKRSRRQGPRRSKRPGPEAGHQPRVGGPADGGQGILGQGGPLGGEGSHPFFVSVCIQPQSGGGGLHGLLQQGCGSVVKGVGQGRLGVNPLQTMGLQVQAAPERRSNSHGVDGRADVVAESGQGPRLGGAHPAPRLVVGLKHHHLPALLGQGYGGAQPVGAAADHRGIKVRAHRAQGPTAGVCTANPQVLGAASGSTWQLVHT